MRCSKNADRDKFVKNKKGVTMPIVRPFKGLRPKPEFAEKVASPPYDVMSSDEAREMAKENQSSFLHVIKPEVDVDPSVSLYDEQIYDKGKANLQRLIDEGYLVQDKQNYLYIYKLQMGDHIQNGLVATVSVEDYEREKIKKHEYTRLEKEKDRAKHINVLNAQAGPVFLTYKADTHIDALIKKAQQVKPVYDFVADDNIRHTFYIVKDKEIIENIQRAFAKLDHLYVADGHHRSAAAARVKKERQEKNQNHAGDEEYNYFLTVIFPHNQMFIMDYNRVVADLCGHSPDEFLTRITEKFEVQKRKNAFRPEEKHHFGMFMNGKWYQLIAREDTFNKNDPVLSLDVSILQENLLKPILEIQDPRKDKRISFVGGKRGLGELEQLVNSGQFAVAFAMYPTSIEELMAIADAGKVMPPKSTWFEPKLRSGLITHLL